MAPPSDGVRIGDAAASLGVPAHVLRHWEDVGAVVPPRGIGGQRIYDPNLLARARVVQRCQRAGLSLAEIVELFSARPRSRQAELLTVKQARLRTAVENLLGTIDFLDHVIDCQHPILSDCPSCSGFSQH